MIPSLEGLPTMAKEAPSPHEVRLAPLGTNPVFHSLRENPDPKTQAQEVIFSRKTVKDCHPSVFFNDSGAFDKSEAFRYSLR